MCHIRGVLRPEREIGLFVLSGGLTRDARREAEGASRVGLVNLDDFVALSIRHAAAIPGAARGWLELSPVDYLGEAGHAEDVAPADGGETDPAGPIPSVVAELAIPG